MNGYRLWQIAGWTMLHYLWLGTAVGAVVLLARAGLREAAANVRYLVAVGSLLVLSVSPAAIAIVVVQSLGHAAPVVPPPGSFVGRPETPHFEGAGPMTTAADTSAAPATATDLSAAAPQPSRSQRLWAALNLAVMGLPWLWICGAPLVFALTTTGLLGAERLRRQSRPLEDGRIGDLCRQLAASLSISYSVGVAICDRIAAPILVGIFRPMI
jgi:hypothetical protein